MGGRFRYDLGQAARPPGVEAAGDVDHLLKSAALEQA